MSTYTTAACNLSKARPIVFAMLVNELEQGMERVWVFRIGISNVGEEQPNYAVRCVRSNSNDEDRYTRRQNIRTN